MEKKSHDTGTIEIGTQGSILNLNLNRLPF